MKSFSVFESLGELLAIVLWVVLFVAMFAVVGCERSSDPAHAIVTAFDLSDDLVVEENVVLVSKSYKVITDSDVLYVYRVDINEQQRIATIEQVDVASVALYETPLSVGYPLALLVVGVPNADNGKGVVYVFSVSPAGSQLQEEIVPFHSSTLGFGSFVQFEHVDDVGWWLSIESADGESFSVPIGRWF